MSELNYPALVAQLKAHPTDAQNQCFVLNVDAEKKIAVYPNSIRQAGNLSYFIGRDAEGKALWVAGAGKNFSVRHQFDSEQVCAGQDFLLLRCPLCNQNANIIRSNFTWTRPRCLGGGHAFGFGDRLGIANPAHVRVAKNSRLKAVFAQQSIRELERTAREPQEVIDAATWAVFQEGYTRGFGADADHLKTEADIDRMVRAGYTMFTIDPGDEVIDAADSLPIAEVAAQVDAKIPSDLGIAAAELTAAYSGKKIVIDAELRLQPDREAVLRCLLKYSGVVAKTVRLWRYLAENYPQHPVEIELSVDETESVTSAFEHYFISNELQQRGIKLISLAPRFIGRFEKGVDYIGDVAEFMREYSKHQHIARKMGGYKIGFHSGSDKFSIYQAVAKQEAGSVHIKTAGTSYLEALRTIAAADSALFRKIFNFCRDLYEEERRTYHVSAQLQNVPVTTACSDAQLPALLDDDDARQVLHVTYGRVLTEKNARGERLFYDQIMDCLRENSDLHEANLMRHFQRHLAPFDKIAGKI